MAQSASSFASVIKDVWTSDTLQKQFEAGNKPLGEFENFKGTPIGTQAQVPIYSGRSFGYTSTSASGGSLNAAQQQSVAQATYTVPYHWFQISLETSAIAQANGGNSSIVNAKDFEIENAVENLKHQMVRQLVTNGDGIIAACGTASSATVPLTAATSEGSAYGYSALVRGWLAPGATVDIGTTADTDALATAATISAVSVSAGSPTITIGSSISTTAGTHYVYVPNPNSATAANTEMNGLRQIVNSSGALGGLNPATAGQEYWQAAARDTTTTILSIDLLLAFQRQIRQNGGEKQAIWTGLKQQSNLYSLLQNQIRFSGDTSLTAGADQTVKWNDVDVKAFADILDTDLFMLSPSDLVKVVTPGVSKPTWIGDLQGSNTGFQWSPNQTAFSDAIVWPVNLACHRRNTHAAATALQ